MAFGCPRCGRVSQSPQDEANGYCARCRDFTGQEHIRYGLLPLLDVFELRELLALLPEPATYLHTMVAEAILNARSERHSRAVQMIYSLARVLATMKLNTIPGDELDGFKMFRRMLETMERFVRDHGLLEQTQLPDIAEASQVIDIEIGEPPEWLLEVLAAPTSAPVDVSAPRLGSMPKPTLCRAVIYRSKTAKYDLAAMVAGTLDSLYRPAVEEGHVADLDSDEHVHLVVFTPGYQGHRNSTTTAEQEAELTRLSTPAGGTYQEFNVAHDQTGQTPGTWRWPERV